MSSAWLIHAPPGYGKWHALRQVAAGLLCEAPLAGAPEGQAAARLPSALAAQRACQRCASCALLHARTHPDLLIVAPEALWPELGLAAEGEGAVGGESKGASQDIRIEQIRLLNDWAVRTSHRGHAKVALIYPADALNPAAANALLKTLEEPPPGVQFFLGAHRIDALLPTIRSRCRHAAMPRPSDAELRQTLGDAADPAVLAWCQGAIYQPDPARGLKWAQSLLDALVSQPRANVAAWPQPPDFPTAVVALIKIGTDLQRVRAGGKALFLPQSQPQLCRLAARVGAVELADALQRLRAHRRLAGFALNQPLACDALLLEFAQSFPPGD